MAKKIAGIHTAILLNGEALKTGFLYRFPKTIKVLSHPIGKSPKLKKIKSFSHGRLREFVLGEGYHFSSSKGDEVFIFCVTEKELSELRPR